MKSRYNPDLWGQRRPGYFFQQVKSLVILDLGKPHMEDVVESFKRYNTECKIIHGFMTPLLQFTDTHINKRFILVITCLGGQFKISCSSEILKILKLSK